MTATERSADARERLIVALDYPGPKQAMDAVDRLEGTCQWFKVGLELYLAAGNPVIEALTNRGLSVFLDLKLHDIPNTIAGAVCSAAATGAKLLTIHALGGPAMLEAAAKAASGPNAPKLLAVTVLTSMDQLQLGAVGVGGTPADEVKLLAKMAITVGMSGLVCSGEEVPSLRSELGNSPLLVVPGIRPAQAEVGDQRRVVTPATAIAAGASMLVVGRPITQAADPAAAAAAILKEMESAVLIEQSR